MEGRSLNGQCSGLSRKETESVGKNVEEEAKGLDCFKSGLLEFTSEYLDIR